MQTPKGTKLTATRTVILLMPAAIAKRIKIHLTWFTFLFRSTSDTQKHFLFLQMIIENIITWPNDCTNMASVKSSFNPFIIELVSNNNIAEPNDNNTPWNFHLDICLSVSMPSASSNKGFLISKIAHRKIRPSFEKMIVYSNEGWAEIYLLATLLRITIIGLFNCVVV